MGGGPLPITPLPIKASLTVNHLNLSRGGAGRAWWALECPQPCTQHLNPFILSPGWHLPSCPPLQLCGGTLLFVRYSLRLVAGDQGNAQGLALSLVSRFWEKWVNKVYYL